MADHDSHFFHEVMTFNISLLRMKLKGACQMMAQVEYGHALN